MSDDVDTATQDFGTDVGVVRADVVLLGVGRIEIRPGSRKNSITSILEGNVPARTAAT